MNGYRGGLLLAHVANALARYENDMHRDGFPVPPEYVQVREFVMYCARARQDASSLDELLDLREPEGMANHPVLRKREVAVALRVSMRTVDRLIASGALPAVHVEGSTRVRRTDLENYVASLDGSRSFREGVSKKETA